MGAVKLMNPHHRAGYPKKKGKINTTQLYNCLYGFRQRRHYVNEKKLTKRRLSPKQGISWRELQAAIFATTRSRQYRSCMEIIYIKCKRIKLETQGKTSSLLHNTKTTFYTTVSEFATLRFRISPDCFKIFKFNLELIYPAC